VEKILLVDDIAYGLAATAAMLRGRFQVLCADPDDPVRSALDCWGRQDDVRLAVVDLSLPGGACEPTVDVGFRLIADLKRLRPKSWILARSAYDTPENLARAVAVAADGFIGRDWPRKDVLGNAQFLPRWAAAGTTWSGPARAREHPDADAAGRGGRVRELCRAILGRLPDASPQNFDLAACLVAAEWLDARRRAGGGPAPEDHEELSRWLAGWGPGSEKVAAILALRQRCYGEPRSDQLLDHPGGADLPRGEDLPLEARVLRAADALDGLAAARPAPGPEAIRAALWEQTRLGALDPKVTAALDRVLADDRAPLPKSGGAPENKTAP
jgi:CheY-like chemotaxis protein